MLMTEYVRKYTIDEQREILIEDQKQLISDTMLELTEATEIYTHILKDNAAAMAAGFYHVKYFYHNRKEYTLESALNAVNEIKERLDKRYQELENIKHGSTSTVNELFDFYLFFAMAAGIDIDNLMEV